MNIDKEIKKLEKKIDALKARSLKSDTRRKTTALRRVFAVVKKFGFDSIHELLEISDTAVVATTTKKKRSKIDDATRKNVIAMIKSGETVAKTAKTHKISAPSVNNIKKAAGLTKSKKTRAIKIHPLSRSTAPKKIAKQLLRRAQKSVKGPKGLAKVQLRLKPRIKKMSKTVDAPSIPPIEVEAAAAV